MNGTPLKAAIWARVSTEDQETGNQLTVLARMGGAPRPGRRGRARHGGQRVAGEREG